MFYCVFEHAFEFVGEVERIFLTQTSDHPLRNLSGLACFPFCVEALNVERKKWREKIEMILLFQAQDIVAFL